MLCGAMMTMRQLEKSAFLALPTTRTFCALRHVTSVALYTKRIGTFQILNRQEALWPEQTGMLCGAMVKMRHLEKSASHLAIHTKKIVFCDTAEV